MNYTIEVPLESFGFDEVETPETAIITLPESTLRRITERAAAFFTNREDSGEFTDFTYEFEVDYPGFEEMKSELDGAHLRIISPHTATFVVNHKHAPAAELFGDFELPKNSVLTYRVEAKLFVDFKVNANSVEEAEARVQSQIDKHGFVVDLKNHDLELYTEEETER